MKRLVALLLLAVSPMAHASYDYTGTIQMVLSGPAYNGLIFLQVATPPWGTVACDSNSTFDFVFDSSTPAGKSTLAQILTAYAGEKTVRLVSSDTCSLYSGIPNLDTLSLK